MRLILEVWRQWLRIRFRWSDLIHNGRQNLEKYQGTSRVNLLRLSDVNELSHICFRSSLLACSLESHHINQCRHDVNQNSFQWNLNQNNACIKMNLNISSTKRWPFCRGFSVLITQLFDIGRNHCQKTLIWYISNYISTAELKIETELLWKLI